MPWFWKKDRSDRVAVGCPACGAMEAERKADVREPWTDRIVGALYGCTRCMRAFTVVNGTAAFLGDAKPQTKIQNSPPPQFDEGPRVPKQEVPLLRDEDMKWSR